MTRSILALFGACITIAVLVGANGCSQSGVGDPCVPEQEFNATFNGFDEKEVNVESKSFQCQTRLCLVNHFRGRVTCPYGQDATGSPPAGAKECTLPGSSQTLEGNPNAPKEGKAVPPQCKDRRAKDAVYCSCRCADINGETKDGNFCTCPDGFVCRQLVTSIGQGDTGLTGAYCIKAATDFDRNNVCSASCDSTAGDCPN